MSEPGHERLRSVEVPTVSPIAQPPVVDANMERKSADVAAMLGPDADADVAAKQEQLRSELRAAKVAARGLTLDLNGVLGGIEALMEKKGLTKELKAASTYPSSRDILAAIVPTKQIGLLQLGKLLDATTHEIDREELRSIIRKIEALPDATIRQLSETRQYQDEGIVAAYVTTHNDSLRLAQYGRVTGSPDVQNATMQNLNGVKRQMEVEAKIQADPDLSAQKAVAEDLRRQISAMYSTIGVLERKLQA